MSGPSSLWRVCVDDGTVVGNDPGHQVFHARLAVPMAELIQVKIRLAALEAFLATTAGYTPPVLPPLPALPTEEGDA